MAPAHVLVPMDGSPLADAALAHALDVFSCPVTVLNVVTTVDNSMSEGGVLEDDAARRATARERAEELVQTATRQAEEAGRDVDAVVETGTPAETILEYVAEHDVDHVVMGGHGGPSDGLVGRLLGTVATRVVSEAPVTVTVVR